MNNTPMSLRGRKSGSRNRSSSRARKSRARRKVKARRKVRARKSRARRKVGVRKRKAGLLRPSLIGKHTDLEKKTLRRRSRSAYLKLKTAYKNYSLGYVERRMTASLPHKPPKIYSIVSSQPDGFVVHSNEMDLNQPYWFQYEDSTYEIKKNLNKELVMLEVA